MKATLEDITSVKKRLVVEIEPEEIGRRIEKAYKELSKNAKISGFRAGKIPRRILESYYGNQLMEDLSRDLVTETLPTAVEETKTYPVSAPSIEKGGIAKGEAFRYTAVMEVKPEFQVENYLGLEVEKEIVSLGDEDVESQLEEIRKAHGEMKALAEDRGIEKGDYAVITYQGYEDGEAIDGIQASHFALEIGGNRFHPDFEEKLLGMKKGDLGDITVSFDSSYFHEKLSGRTVDFKVTIEDIQVRELPELTDAFVAGLGADLSTLQELKDRIKEDLQRREEKRVNRELKSRLLAKISEEIDIELPESLVEAEIDSAVESVKQNLMRSGGDMEKAGLSEQKVREDFRPASEQRTKNMLILDEIAKQNDLTISEVELTDGFTELALSMGQDAQTVRSYYDANRATEAFREKLLEEKTLNYLVNNAKINEVEANKLTKKNEDEV